jgi:hypothetical protein
MSTTLIGEPQPKANGKATHAERHLVRHSDCSVVAVEMGKCCAKVWTMPAESSAEQVGSNRKPKAAGMQVGASRDNPGRRREAVWGRTGRRVAPCQAGADRVRFQGMRRPKSNRDRSSIGAGSGSTSALPGR